MNTIAQIKRNSCTGCSACAQICPNGSIGMVADSEGFLYPQVDAVTCSDCSSCYAICPVVNRSNSANPPRLPIRVLGAWHLDPQIRNASSSGGVFSAIAHRVLSNKGVVFGAAFDDTFCLKHTFIEDPADLFKLRGSKYLQSDINNTFVQVQSFVDCGRAVLFSGTPCQVAGLKSFLNAECANLITCDFVCAGVPSPKVFQKYRRYLECKYGAPTKHISFRDKSRGWKQASLVMTFQNGATYSHRLHDDPYGIGFGNFLYQRPSCYECIFRKFMNKGDITLGDFWGVGTRRPDLDDDHGTSLVLINSHKGDDIFKECSDELHFAECDLDHAMVGNPRLGGSRQPSSERAFFFRDVEAMPFDAIIAKYMHKPLLERVIRKLLKRIKVKS
jgi:coenzyme F420-reducing hydrogenase beta subunit